MKKNIASLEKHLHPDIEFKTPLGEKKGREEYLGALKGFLSAIQELTIREIFEKEKCAVVIYDVDFSDPIGKVPTTSLLHFHEGLIRKVELFYDGRPFTP